MDEAGSAGGPVWAVNDLSTGGWAAGAGVSRTVCLALAAAGENVAMFGGNGCGVRVIPRPVARPLPGINTLCRVLGWRVPDCSSGVLRRARAAALVPVVEVPAFRSPPSVGWIPDFQHIRLPERFSAGQRKALDDRFVRLARGCGLVWLSSRDAAADFARCFPEHRGKARVASFPSLFAFEPPAGDPRPAVGGFRVPGRFLLVINQFWGHKNHVLVARALGILASRGVRIPAVMAGMPADYRDRENSALSDTLGELARSGAWADCLVLGKVPRDAVVALLRCATALVQPSRFEGWNTSVEDAKAVGCPVFASDIPVHREQCPDAVGYFGCDDAEALAGLIGSQWDSLPTRPDIAAEEAALGRAAVRGLEFGKEMARMCREVAGL